MDLDKLIKNEKEFCLHALTITLLQHINIDYKQQMIELNEFLTSMKKSDSKYINKLIQVLQLYSRYDNDLITSLVNNEKIITSLLKDKYVQDQNQINNCQNHMISDGNNKQICENKTKTKTNKDEWWNN